MPETIVLCPYCGKPCQRLEAMVPKHIAFGCRACVAFRLEDDARWLVGGGNMAARLAELVKENERARDVDQEMIQSDITDIRWQHWST